MRKTFNIVLIGGINNYFYREVKRALVALGHNVILMQNALEIDCDVDFILCINDVREVLPARLQRIPLVSWVGERPTWPLMWNAVQAKQADIVFVTDKVFCEEFKKELQNTKIEWLPLATSFNKMDPIDSHDYELSFVGNTMQQNINEMENSQGFFRLPIGGESQKVIKCEIDREIAINPMIDLYALCDILQDKNIVSAHIFNGFRKDLVYAYIGMVMTYCKRQRILSDVNEKYHMLVIPEEWKNHIRQLEMPGSGCAYENVSSIYNRTKVNINISSMHLPSACNSRPFDIPICGGFLVTDNRKYIEELFSDNEIVTYQSIEELHELIHFYLQNDTARKRVIEAAQERIMAEHTYQNRIEKLISMVQTELL